MTPEPTEAIPGFTAEQSWSMNIVAERAADRAAQKAIDKLRENGCPVESCAVKKTVEGHHVTLYGDDGRGGLCAVVQDTQTTVRASRKLAWAAVGAAIGAVPAGVLSVILFFASRGG